MYTRLSVTELDSLIDNAIGDRVVPLPVGEGEISYKTVGHAMFDALDEFYRAVILKGLPDDESIKIPMEEINNEIIALIAHPTDDQLDRVREKISNFMFDNRLTAFEEEYKIIVKLTNLAEQQRGIYHVGY